MVKVLYFARVKEALGIGEETLSLTDDITTVGQLLNYLIDSHGEKASVLTAKNLVMAVNHEVTNTEQRLKKGDEVAFYPPVTGG